MLSIGACYLLDKLLGEDHIPKQIRLRLLIFFNGHPYLVPHAIAGISCEIQRKTDDDRIMKFVESVAGFLGAIGDQYYWNSLKPVCVLAPVAAVAFELDSLTVGFISASALIFYNWIQLNERYKGIKQGKALGFAIISKIKLLKTSWINLHFAKIAFLLVSICLIMYLGQIYHHYDLMASAIVSTTLGFISGRRGNSKKYLVSALLIYTLFEVFIW
jgi:mannose/fructose/N-acetylgalactosamine-specific phosphotransferase system component IID